MWAWPQSAGTSGGTGEEYLPIASSWRIAVAFGVVAVGACSTLPPEQLLLPSAPISTVEGPKAQGGAPLAKLSQRRGATEAVGTDKVTGTPAPRPGVGAAKNGVTLNIVEASIPEAAKLILGDMLGVTYTISDKVKGSVSIQTVNPVPKEALVEIFEDALRSAGAAIVVQNNAYRILPSGEAVASAPLKGAGKTYRGVPGVSTHVVPLRYVAAAEMERILKAIAPNASLLRTDTDRNLLIVAGTRSDLDAIMDAVAVFDVDWMKGMSFGVYPLESADPEAVAQELDTVFANDRDSPGKGIVRFIPNRRLKSVLVISQRAEYLRRAQSWIHRLDTATEATVRQVFIYPVRSRTAAELARLLRRIYGGQEAEKSGPKAPVAPPGSIQPTTSMMSSGGLAAPARGPSGLQPRPPAQAAEPLPEAEPAPAPAAPTAAADGPRDDRLAGISVIEDEPNNSLIITATAQEYRRVLQVLERLDVAPNQILLEATIAEVDLTDELKMGVRWFFQAGNSNLTFNDLTNGAVGSAFPGFSNFFNTGNIQAVFRALSSVTEVNIISSPSLMVLDNKKATLEVGNEVPIVTQQATSQITIDAPTVNSVNYRSTGILLNITPRIGDKGRILLEVEQEASEVVKTDTSGIDSPTIAQRRIKTTVAVNDGEGLVLGGLIQDRSENQRDHVPLVGQVPVLGNLFKNKDDKITRTELLVALTPRIVKDRAQVRAITEEFRSRLNFTTRPQRKGPPGKKEQIDRLIR